MNHLNICIDIDGTITDPYYWLELCNWHFKTNITEDEVTEYEIHKILKVERKAYCDFYEKYKLKIHSEQKLRKDVKEVINDLSKDCNIYFVTARETSLELLTRSYLKRHQLPFNDVFVLGSHYKVPKAIDLNCDIFIEDNYDVATELSSHGFKVLLLDTNYNRHPLNHNITRVYSWKEIHYIISQLMAEKRAI